MVFRIDKKKLFIACAMACMTVNEAIKIAGCSTATLQRINDGKPVQSITVGKLCRALKVKPSELLAE